MTDVANLIIEPSHEKTNNLGCRPGRIQIGLYIDYKHGSRLDP